MSPPTSSLAPAFAPIVAHLTETLRGLRAGRATPGLVENVLVDVYGSRQPLKALARIGTADAKTIVVEPWDKAHVKAIEQALQASPLGIPPVTAGTIIRLAVPPLTEERRRELTKLVRQNVEEARISIRGVREKTLRELKTQKERGELSEDAFERARKTVQAETDAAVADAEAKGAAKEAEILAV